MVVICICMRNFLFCLIAFFAGTTVYSQTLRGKVVDQNKAALTGAVVFQKATSNGVVTDYDGEFSIKVSQLPTTLVVKYVGFADQEISVRNTDFIMLFHQESLQTTEKSLLCVYC